jgi:hypothetical protein
VNDGALCARLVASAAKPKQDPKLTGLSILEQRADRVPLSAPGSRTYPAPADSDALRGGAADVCGNVSVAGVYAYVEQRPGPWDQRPLFKSHVSTMASAAVCPIDMVEF